MIRGCGVIENALRYWTGMQAAFHGALPVAGRSQVRTRLFFNMLANALVHLPAVDNEVHRSKGSHRSHYAHLDSDARTMLCKASWRVARAESKNVYNIDSLRLWAS